VKIRFSQLWLVRAKGALGARYARRTVPIFHRNLSSLRILHCQGDRMTLERRSSPNVSHRLPSLLAVAGGGSFLVKPNSVSNCDFEHVRQRIKPTLLCTNLHSVSLGLLWSIIRRLSLPAYTTRTALSSKLMSGLSRRSIRRSARSTFRRRTMKSTSKARSGRLSIWEPSSHFKL